MFFVIPLLRQLLTINLYLLIKCTFWRVSFNLKGELMSYVPLRGALMITQTNQRHQVPQIKLTDHQTNRPSNCKNYIVTSCLLSHYMLVAALLYLKYSLHDFYASSVQLSTLFVRQKIEAEKLWWSSYSKLVVLLSFGVRRASSFLR